MEGPSENPRTPQKHSREIRKGDEFSYGNGRNKSVKQVQGWKDFMEREENVSENVKMEGRRWLGRNEGRGGKES